MARPRKDDGTPSGKERLRQAMWDLLKERPFDQLSVKELCSAAGIQRNTFYYHYEGVFDLAADAVADLPIENYARGLLTHAQQGSTQMATYIGNAQSEPFFQNVLRLAGPNGSPLLVEMYMERVWQTWREILDLQKEPPLVFYFMMGGLLTTLTKLENLPEEEFQAQLREVPIHDMFQVVFLNLQKGGNMPDSVQA